MAHRALRADGTELVRMGSEKLFAFGESWNAMLLQGFWEYQRLMLSFTFSFWLPVLGAGLAPVHRRVLANARRLRRRRARR